MKEMKREKDLELRKWLQNLDKEDMTELIESMIEDMTYHGFVHREKLNMTPEAEKANPHIAQHNESYGTALLTFRNRFRAMVKLKQTQKHENG